MTSSMHIISDFNMQIHRDLDYSAAEYKLSVTYNLDAALHIRKQKAVPLWPISLAILGLTLLETERLRSMNMKIRPPESYES